MKLMCRHRKQIQVTDGHIGDPVSSQYQDGYAVVAILVQIFPPVNLLVSIIKTLRPRQNNRHFPDDILKGIFMNENV